MAAAENSPLSERGPLSLQEHCFLHIICHLEQYSPSQLALLPLHWRRFLLNCIAPFHLYRLEKTSVADGIDTDAIWAEISGLTDSVWGSYRVLDSVEDSWRDCFISYICHLLLNEKNRSFALKRISLLLFALHKQRLDRDTTNVLSHHVQSFFISLPPYYLVPFRCPVNTEIDVALLLIENGAFPKVIEVTSMAITDCQLWKQKENGILCYLLSEVRSIKLSCDRKVSTFILKVLTERSESNLRWVQLWNPSVHLLHSIVPLFGGPSGYTYLEKFQICKKKPPNVVGNHYLLSSAVALNLSSMLLSQNALESLTLMALHTNSIRHTQDLCSAIVDLIRQPQFEKLKLQYFDNLPLEAIQILVLAILSSSPKNQLFFVLEDSEIVASSAKDGYTPTLPPLVPNSSRLSGLRKHIYFTKVELPSQLIEWLCSVEYIYLSTLDFCGCYVTNSMNESPEQCFAAHPNFFVPNFRFAELKLSDFLSS